MERKRGRSWWSKRAFQYPSFQFVYTLCLFGMSVSFQTCPCAVYSLRRSEEDCSSLLKVARGAVELVWHPLFGIFQVTDSLALHVF